MLISRDRAVRMLAGDALGFSFSGDPAMRRMRGALGGLSSRRALMRGDPGFFSFLGGAVKSFLGLPPASSAAVTVGPAIARALGPPFGPNIGGGVPMRATHLGERMFPISRRALPGTIAAQATLVRGGRPAGALIPTQPLLPAFHRRRRMRVTNPRALRRAMRRVQGFAKLAHRTISFTHRVRMRRRRRR